MGLRSTDVVKDTKESSMAVCHFLPSPQMTRGLQSLCSRRHSQHCPPCCPPWAKASSRSLHRGPCPHGSSHGRRGRSPSRWKDGGPAAKTGESQVLRKTIWGSVRGYMTGEPPGQEIMSPKLWEWTSCDRWLISTILRGSEMTSDPISRNATEP